MMFGRCFTVFGVKTESIESFVVFPSFFINEIVCFFSKSAMSGQKFINPSFFVRFFYLNLFLEVKLKRAGMG